jgi:hypothetical protein
VAEDKGRVEETLPVLAVKEKVVALAEELEVILKHPHILNSEHIHSTKLSIVISSLQQWQSLYQNDVHREIIAFQDRRAPSSVT